MRVLATVMYNGYMYNGWQIQKNGSSVEEEIERVLSKLLNQDINILGAGRTDGKVHAFGQTFHFDFIGKKIDLHKLIYACNRLLPHDIKIIKMKYVSLNFHARINAKKKEYEYLIKLDSKDPFLNNLVYICPFDLKIKKIREAMKLFIGEHDFRCFTSKDEDFLNYKREIYSFNVKKMRNENILVFNIKGSGFMRYMIRFIIGTLLEIGREKIDIDFVKNHLDVDVREVVPYKAPPEGLYLKKVYY